MNAFPALEINNLPAGPPGPRLTGVPRITICSQDSLEEAITRVSPQCVISLRGESETLPIGIGTASHYWLRVKDVTTTRVRRAPSVSHILALRHILELHQGQDILVHCLRGLSRSPAAAIALLCLSGATPEAACESLRRAIPSARPNLLLLHSLDLLIARQPSATETAAMIFDYSSLGPEPEHSSVLGIIDGQ